MPKVSIIIPCYGVEKYLARCMDSILNQTLGDIEIILVDDGSPDRVPEMCDGYAQIDSRVKVIHKTNAGLGYARNSGLEIATGEYVAFVDSDDFVSVDMYQKLYSTACENDSDVVYCGYNIETDIPNKWMRSHEVEYERSWNGTQITEFLLDMIASDPHVKQERKFYMSVWHSIYRNRLVQDNNIKFYSEREVASEDLPFQTDFLLKASRVDYIPDNFYYYCGNSSTLSGTFKKGKYNAIKKLYSIIREKTSGVPDAPLRCARFFAGYARSQLFHLFRSDEPDKMKHLKEIVNSKIWTEISRHYPADIVASTFQRSLYRLILSKRYRTLYTVCCLVPTIQRFIGKSRGGQ